MHREAEGPVLGRPPHAVQGEDLVLLEGLLPGRLGRIPEVGAPAGPSFGPRHRAREEGRLHEGDVHRCLRRRLRDHNLQRPFHEQLAVGPVRRRERVGPRLEQVQPVASVAIAGRLDVLVPAPGRDHLHAFEREAEGVGHLPLDDVATGHPQHERTPGGTVRCEGLHRRLAPVGCRGPGVPVEAPLQRDREAPVLVRPRVPRTARLTPPAVGLGPVLHRGGARLGEGHPGTGHGPALAVEHLTRQLRPRTQGHGDRRVRRVLQHPRIPQSRRTRRGVPHPQHRTPGGDLEAHHAGLVRVVRRHRGPLAVPRIGSRAAAIPGRVGRPVRLEVGHHARRRLVGPDLDRRTRKGDALGIDRAQGQFAGHGHPADEHHPQQRRRQRPDQSWQRRQTASESRASPPLRCHAVTPDPPRGHAAQVSHRTGGHKQPRPR